MLRRTKIILAAVVIGVAGLVLAGELVQVRQDVLRAGKYTSNTGELLGSALVGQTFVAPEDDLSGIGVMMATYGGRRQTQPVWFHLRTSLEAREDLRTVQVAPGKFRDNEVYRFAFAPIPDSKGKTYFFFLTSPTSRPGDAVTVDINTQNPYYLGSAFIVRPGMGAATDPGVLLSAGKPTADVVFSTYHKVPLRQAVVARARQSLHAFVGSWPNKKDGYKEVALLSLPAAAFVALVAVMGFRAGEPRRWRRRTVIIIVGALVIAGLVWRLLYAVRLPLTSDEGNYLYDAWSLLQGRLAGGDGYVKAPLVIVWMALAQLVFGHVVMAGRVAAILAGVATAWPVYLLGREAGGNERTGIASAGAWLLLGAPAVFHIYAHTQSLAIFFGVLGVAMSWLSTRGRMGKMGEHLEGEPSLPRWFILSGVVLGLAVISRKSMLALGLLPLAAIIIEGRSWRERIKHLLLVGIGFGVVIAAFLGAAYQMYGWQGIWEAVGVNSAEDSVRIIDPIEVERAREYSLRGMTPFFRESLPLILLGLLGWGLLGEQWLRGLGRSLHLWRPRAFFWWLFVYLLPKLMWLPPLLAFLWAWGFFREYEGGVYVSMGGMYWLWPIMGLVLLISALWMPRREERHSGAAPRVIRTAQGTEVVIQAPQVAGRTPGFARALARWQWRQGFLPMLLLPLWMGGTVFFYQNWIKFHANYIVEFLPPLVVLGGVGVFLWWRQLMAGAAELTRRWQRITQRTVAVAFLMLVFWSASLVNLITYKHPHTGTLVLVAVEAAAEWARQNIPVDRAIFTGAAAVPYVSGHRVALDIAHPRWYAYEFTRKDTQRLNTFLPPAENMVQAFRDAEWVLMDSQTGFSFLMEYTEIERGLEHDFQLVHEIENGSNPLKFYRRVRGAEQQPAL